MSHDLQVEVERKFDVDGDWTIPDLSAVKRVSKVQASEEWLLDATYYDTANHDLSDRGIALRHRTGGHDAGWHLKRPELDDHEVRTEFRVGGDSTRVPEEIVDQVAALARGRALQPIVHIRTKRSERGLLDADGRRLATVADDRVAARRLDQDSASTLRWRELEVELVDGPPTLLDDVATSLAMEGVRRSEWPSKLSHALGQVSDPRAVHRIRNSSGPSSAGALLVAHLADLVDRLLTLDLAVRAEEPDAVHQMRVTTRRLRSALATFRPLFERTTTEPIREELKWLGAVLGRARDAEVLGERLTSAAAALPSVLTLGPVSGRIGFEMRERHQDALVEVRECLSARRYFDLLDSLDQLVLQPPLTGRARRRASREVPPLVERSAHRVKRRIAAANRESDGDGRDVALHDIRKAAKRARYAAEAVESVLGRPGRRLASRMEDLQDLLGQHQDSVGARAVLRQLAVVAHLAGENGFTFGLLYGLEEQRDEDGLAGVERVARRATKPAVVALRR